MLKDLSARRAYAAKYNREIWYPKNRKKHQVSVRLSNKTLVSRARKFIDKIKTERGCMDCGNRDVRVLDFDHIPGRGEKDINISHAAKRCWSKERIMSEVDKCDVRCANCHRIKTYERRKNLHGSGTEIPRSSHTAEIAGSTPVPSNH